MASHFFHHLYERTHKGCFPRSGVPTQNEYRLLVLRRKEMRQPPYSILLASRKGVGEVGLNVFEQHSEMDYY